MSNPVSDTLIYRRELFIYQIIDKIYCSEQWASNIEPEDLSEVPNKILKKVRDSSLVKFHEGAIQSVVKNFKNEDEKIREIEYTSDSIFKIMDEIEIFSYYKNLQEKNITYKLDVSLHSIGFNDLFLRDSNDYAFGDISLTEHYLENYARELSRRRPFNRPVSWLIVVALIFVEHQSYSIKYKWSAKDALKLEKKIERERLLFNVLFFSIDVILFCSAFSTTYYLYSSEDLFPLSFLPIKSNILLMSPLIFLMLKLIKKRIFPDWKADEGVFSIKSIFRYYTKETEIIDKMDELHSRLNVHTNAESLKSIYMKSFDLGIVYNSYIGILLNDFISRNITFEPFEGFGTPFRRRFDP